MVKCTSCGARWRAFQDRSLAEGEPPEDDLLVEGPPVEAPPADDEIVAEPIVPRRDKGKAKSKPKSSPVMAVGLAVLAGLAVAAGAAVILRHQIAGVLPATGPLYAAIGLPVNTLGLVIEGVTSKPGFQAGKPVLSVTGAIRSVSKASVEAPVLRVSLLDREGKAIAGVVARPLNGRVPPGATRYFALSLPDPPAGATELEVAFDPDAPLEAPPAVKVAPAPPSAVAATAPAPLEAQPLAPGSPDALESHD